MKKQILITTVSLALIIFGMISIYGWTTSSSISKVEEINNDHLIIGEMDQNMITNELKTFPDFIYDIGPRFGGIKKSEIEKITSIEAFLDEDVIKHIAAIKSTSIALIIDEKRSDIKVHGTTAKFNKAQLELLRNSKPSTNFVMRVEFDERDPHSGKLFDSYRSPHHTIVPEQQAKYSEGINALKLFLKESCQSVLIGVDPEKLKPAKLYFTVEATGHIKDVRLDRNSGYPEVDQKMIELIHQTPGEWQPAKNQKGESIDQELVVSFGLIGC